MLVKNRWLLLGLVLLLALILRLINLGHRSLWYDEAFAVLFAAKGLDAMVYGTLTPVSGGAADIHPLLYYTLLNLWMSVFGQSPISVRLLSVFLGVATVAIIYFLTDELFDHKVALAASLIAAVAPFHVQYSQEVRMYALLGLLLTAATWCFVKGWRESSAPAVGQFWRLRYWLLFGVLAGLAMYTQQLAAFYLIALGTVPFITRRRDQIVPLVVAVGVAVLVYLPWLVNLPGQFQKVSSYYWLDKPTLSTPLLTIRSFLSAAIDFPSPASLIAFLGALFIVLFLTVQVILVLRQRRRRQDRTPLKFVLWLTVAPPVLMWLVSQFQPVYLERSLLPSAILLYIALGWLLTRSDLPRPIAVVIGGVWVLLIGIGLYYQFTWSTFPNSPFGSAANYIKQTWQEGDVVVHQNKLTALPMIYYEQTITQRLIGDRAGSSDDTLAKPTQEVLGILADSCVQAASRGGQRIWWVVFGFAEQQYQAAGRPELMQAEKWLNEHYSLASSQQFNDLDVMLFSDPRGDLSTVCPS